ncbi:MAG: hypothetical protein ABL995_15205 [Bryobacteraceae bacterium]
MRLFFSRRIPDIHKLLLVESGSRQLVENLIPAFRRHYGAQIKTDLVTCYAGEPAGFEGHVWRVSDYPTPEHRERLFTELAQRGYDAMGIVCSAEPIMTKWKWALGAKIPAKIFIINENSDFFWCDRGNWNAILQFAMFRAGMTGAAAIPTLARLMFFPLTLAYLLLYAGTVHLRRRLRA